MMVRADDEAVTQLIKALRADLEWLKREHASGGSVELALTELDETLDALEGAAVVYDGRLWHGTEA